MRASVRHQTQMAVEKYPVTPRPEWVLQWPAMVVLAASGVHWAKGVEDSIAAGNLKAEAEKNTADLMDLTDLVRGKLSEQDRTTLGALITIDVHARDVVQELCDVGLESVTDFEWVKQLRYYWRDDVQTDMVQVRTIKAQSRMHRASLNSKAASGMSLPGLHVL